MKFQSLGYRMSSIEFVSKHWKWRETSATATSILISWFPNPPVDEVGFKSGRDPVYIYTNRTTVYNSTTSVILNRPALLFKFNQSPVCVSMLLLPIPLCLVLIKIKTAHLYSVPGSCAWNQNNDRWNLLPDGLHCAPHIVVGNL